MVSNRCPLFPLGLLLALAVVVSGLGCPKATPPNPPNQGGMKVVPLDDATPVNAGPVNAGPPAQGVPPDPVAQANPGPRTPDGSKGAGAADADPMPPRPVPSSGGKRYALLVAVQQYDSPDLDDLSFTEADAEDLAKVLRDGGYRPENVVLMTKTRGDKDPSVLPTAERIRAELNELVKRCGPDDLVLVGLTGHGIQPKNGKQLFCGYKAKLDDAKTLLPIDEVYQTIGTSAAGMKLLLVDACRNDPGGKGRDRPVRGDGDYASVTSGTPPTGVIALYSCSEGERSWEPPELKHGLFFHFLIEGLKGKADFYNDGKITWPGMVGYLDRSVNSYAETRLRKRQRPHFKGDTNVQIPLVVWPRESVPADRATVNAPPLNPLDLVNEDFRKVSGGLPPGWKGNFFSVEKDKSGRRCLESTAKEGVHYLSLPEMDLRGDFFVECEFLLDGYPEYQKEDQHRLIVELETPDGTRIPIVVDHEGIVTIKNGQPRAAAEYKPFQITRFRLVREKNTYRVSLNDADARGTPLEYAGDFKTVRFGLVAGVPEYHTLKTTSKIYSIHVGRLAPDKDTAMGPAKDEVTVLLNEDFGQASLGGPPKGWDGTAFSVEKDKNGRRCLEVVAKEGTHFVQLPRLGLRGDFFVECEVLLDGYRDYEKEDQHRLLLELESRDGNRLPVVVSHEGDVTIHRDGQPRRPPNFKPFQVTRVRLVREGTVYRVSLGDDDPTGRTLNYTGDFETIRLGLVAGVPVYHTLNTTSKIYSVKVGLLKGAANPAGPVAAAAGIREDFRKAKVGGLPDGWSLSPAALLTVQKSGERPALEINGMGPGTDAVTLPAVSLKGDFFCDCEFEIASKDALVIVQFEGAARNVVLLQVKGDGKMSMQNRFPGDAGKAWNATPKTNLLRLERKGGAYRVKINDQDVGSLPDTVAPGELTAVKLGMSLKNKDDKTPRIYSVRVVPLDEPAKPE